jgi:hypothetical protein
MANSQHPNAKEPAEKIGLPPRPFLYTLDQIASLLDIGMKSIGRQVWYDRRSIGVATRHQLTARNIAGPNDPPDWRVAETELLRWMRIKGFRYHETGRLRS